MNTRTTTILLTTLFAVILLTASQYTAAAGVPNLKAWWSFDETAGVTAADSAAGNHGTLQGDPIWIDSPLGRALTFDGTGDGVIAPHSPDLNLGSGPFTISAWIQNQNTPGSIWKRIVTKRTGLNWYSLFLNGSQLALEVGPGFVFSAGPAIQGDNQFHHVAVVRNGDGSIVLYVDGIPFPAGVSTADVSNTSSVEIGRMWTEAYDGEMYKGIIDDVRIYDRALTQREIVELPGPKKYEVVTMYFAGTGMDIEAWDGDYHVDFWPNDYRTFTQMEFWWLKPELLATLFRNQKAMNVQPLVHNYNDAQSTYTPPGSGISFVHHKQFIDGIGTGRINIERRLWDRKDPSDPLCERGWAHIMQDAEAYLKQFMVNRPGINNDIILNLVGWSRGGPSAMEFANRVATEKAFGGGDGIWDYGARIKQINLLCFDPVNGHISENEFVPWPGNLDFRGIEMGMINYIGLYAQDERTGHFAPLVPLGMPNKMMFTLPGSHETMTGNCRVKGHATEGMIDGWVWPIDNYPDNRISAVSDLSAVISTKLLGSPQWGAVMFDNSSWTDEDEGELGAAYWPWPVAFSYDGIFSEILSGKPFDQLFADQTELIYNYPDFNRMRHVGFVPIFVAGGWLSGYWEPRYWFTPLPPPYPNPGERFYEDHGATLNTVAPYIGDYNQDQLIKDIVALGGRTPVADAGPDQTLTTNGLTASVTLDGSASYHPGASAGLLLNYNWTYEWTDCDTGELLGSGIDLKSLTVELPLGVHTLSLKLSDSYSTGVDYIQIVVGNPEPVIYVNDDATGENNGRSWDNAFVNLQDALASATPGKQIWVAKGTYKPTAQLDRNVSFAMREAVAIFGGFAGNEVYPCNLDNRLLEANETILSGDIGIDGNTSDNSLHVVSNQSGIQLDHTAILDGFTITGGNANGPFHVERVGGGMYNGSSPLVRNCIIRDNNAITGGGMYNDNGSPMLINCVFTGNTSQYDGAACYNNSANSTIINCTFYGNDAESNGRGGGMYNLNSAPVITNCIFWLNTDTELSGKQIVSHGNARPTITYSCIQYDLVTDYVHPDNLWYPGIGNIYDDPMFVNSGGRIFNLQAASPCIDSASNDDVPEQTLVDRNGMPRIIDGDCDQTPKVDMGAYEYAHIQTANINGDCTVDMLDWVTLSTAWKTVTGNSNWNPRCDISPDGVIDINDLAVFSENWLWQLN